MTVHLQQFIDRVQGFEARGLKDFTMPLSDAKAMRNELTRLLLEHIEVKNKLLAQETQEEVITVEITGGAF